MEQHPYNTQSTVFPLCCKGLLYAPIAKGKIHKVLNGTGKALGLTVFIKGSED